MAPLPVLVTENVVEPAVKLTSRLTGATDKTASFWQNAIDTEERIVIIDTKNIFKIIVHVNILFVLFLT
jgi:hypothetical protein